LLFPALVVAYLFAGRGTLAARWRAIVAAGVVMVVVSLSWMSAVSLVPAHDRPYVDGSTDDSLFTQVFLYNGTTRLGISTGSALVARPDQPFGQAIHESGLAEGTYLLRPEKGKLKVSPDQGVYPRRILAIRPECWHDGSNIHWQKGLEPSCCVPR
jgi:4-amino-4-deoxy-L-arabinose transferase-like glycosyltransferase